MPRKKWTEKIRQEADFVRWRLLVRNPAFLQDLESLRKSRPVPHDWPVEKRRKAIFRKHKMIQRVENKWGLSRIPPMALLRCYGTDLQSLEGYYLSQRDEQGPFPISFAPAALVELKENRFLYGWVDTACPIDRVLAAFETELRKFYRDRVSKQKRGRPDKIDFQLEVFDHVSEMLEKSSKKDFGVVASRLRKPLPTVRKAYWAACRKIGIAGVLGKPGLVDPGAFDECSDECCRAAQKETDLTRAIQLLCPTHRKFYEQIDPSLPHCLPKNPSVVDQVSDVRVGKSKKLPPAE